MTQPISSPVLPPERQAGVCLHITALPGSFGLGELGPDAFRFIDVLQQTGLRLWQFLPVGPAGYGDSPYQLLSTFAGNELLVSVAELCRESLLREEEAAALQALAADAVDFGSLAALKPPLLRKAARRFLRGSNAGRRAEFDAFREQHDDAWLHDYALYRVLKARYHGQSWTNWPTEFRRRDAASLRRLRDAASQDIDEIKVVQFLFRDQWRRLHRYAQDAGVALMGDLPVYLALDSADAWARPDLLRIDADGRPIAVAGVPPDYFSEDGQLWGNPLYDWTAHANEGYAWWTSRLGAAISMTDLVRLDHFRGFEAYWSVPYGAETARGGHWEPGPGEKLLDAMAAALGQLPVVAEDLGDITPPVYALRDRYGLPGMTILQFAIEEGDFDPASIAENTVCYTGTHDNDTTLGWFCDGLAADAKKGDATSRRRRVLEVTSGTPATIARDLIRLAFSSRARLAIAPMQDFLQLGPEARFNTPGTSSGNWRWRMTKEQVDDSTLDGISRLVHDAGR